MKTEKTCGTPGSPRLKGSGKGKGLPAVKVHKKGSWLRGYGGPSPGAALQRHAVCRPYIALSGVDTYLRQDRFGRPAGVVGQYLRWSLGGGFRAGVLRRLDGRLDDQLALPCVHSLHYVIPCTNWASALPSAGKRGRGGWVAGVCSLLHARVLSPLPVLPNHPF